MSTKQAATHGSRRPSTGWGVTHLFLRVHPSRSPDRLSNVVLVDRHLRAADGVLAAGDVANAEHPLFGRIRIEHWAEALNQGVLAGRNLAGPGGTYGTYDRVPYFYSASSTCRCPTWATRGGWDELMVRGSRKVAEPKFVACYLRQGVPRAALRLFGRGWAY